MLDAKKMTPELKRAIRKMELMKVLGVEPYKIYDEGRKFFCDFCIMSEKGPCQSNRHTANNTNGILPSSKVIFRSRKKSGLYDFTIYDCWRAK